MVIVTVTRCSTIAEVSVRGVPRSLATKYAVFSKAVRRPPRDTARTSAIYKPDLVASTALPRPRAGTSVESIRGDFVSNIACHSILYDGFATVGATRGLHVQLDAASKKSPRYPTVQAAQTPHEREDGFISIFVTEA